MFFVKPSTKLADVVSEHDYLIPVINRFGIRLGIGEKTISSICSEYSVDEDFFLIIINTYLNEDFFPEKRLQNFDITLVADYLRKIDSYYVKGHLPNIERHLKAFISMSDSENKQLKLIDKIFNQFKEEFVSRVEKGFIEDDTSYPLLLDIKNILIKHISGNYNDNLCYAVLFSINSLQKDLEKHNRIREKILKPMIENLTQSGIDDWQSFVNFEKKDIAEHDNAISQREIDVLKLIALDYINKEIANKLNISLNTVLSHRKNITSKLGIKTVSGLTFYCLSHGYISPDSIEL